MDNIKCLMILGIVLEHSLMIYGYPRWIELFWAIFISWLMPLFTLISGFFSKEYEFKTLLKKYLYPMFLFSAVNFLVGYAFNPAYKTGVHLIGYAMWYLWALFFFVYLTPKIQRKVRLKKLLIASLLLALLFPILPDVGIGKWLNILSFNRLVGFFPFFLVGCLLKRHYTAFCKKLTALWGHIIDNFNVDIYRYLLEDRNNSLEKWILFDVGRRC